MSLPPRLWLPDGVHELPTAVPAGQLSGLWPGGPAAAAEALAQLPATAAPRLRRRALLRADAGLPERPVLIEWLPRSELDAVEAERRKGACHANLLRLHHVGLADARTAYLISEAPAGVDLLTVHRAAAGQLPAWWGVAVVAAAARGLSALHQHLQRRGGAAHGGIELGTLFVAWSGAVQLLAYAPRGQAATAAPELQAAPRLITPAADVHALATVLKALLPAAALARGPLPPLIRRCLLPHAEQRPALSALAAALETVLWELEAPLGRATAIGEILGGVCPRQATADLADAEWGDSALASFATLPATLFPLSPLSTGAVQLSPTWAMAPPEPTLTVDRRTVPPPAPASRRGPLIFAGATLGLALLGGVALWGAAEPERPLAPPTAGGPAVGGSRADGSAAAANPVVLPSPLRAAPGGGAGATPAGAGAALTAAGSALGPAPARVPLSAAASSVRWGALRLQILQVHPAPSGLRVQLRLTNPTARPLQAELATLTAGPQRASERQPPQPLPPPLLIGGGRTILYSLDYLLPAAAEPGPLVLQLQP